jgi:thiamine-phosphate pyrophosphorylase
MASRLALAKLARAARALNARDPRAGRLPPLILMTDADRIAAALPSARALPRGSSIVLRHPDATARAGLGAELIGLAKARGLVVLIAGDAALALRLGANGLHLSEARAREAFHWKARRPDWLITAAAHSARAIAEAAAWGADAAILAPVFPTRSHRERAAIPVARVLIMARAAPLAVYALGGITVETAKRLAGAKLAGLAAIEGLAPDHKE